MLNIIKNTNRLLWTRIAIALSAASLIIIIHYSGILRSGLLQKDNIPEILLKETNESATMLTTANKENLHDPFPRPGLSLLLGKIMPQDHPDLVPVELQYASRAGMYLHREAYKAFIEMHAAAQSGGIKLTIVSAFRDFNHQKRIWENKWTGRQILSGNINATSITDETERAREILRFSAMPGTSRHHWGTDIDINSLNNSYFASGKGKREYEWLQENAGRFGFCQPYTPIGDLRSGGHEEEKWHWSYMPVSEPYLKTWRDSVDYSLISGFPGWETAEKLNVIKNYILEINRDCLK